VPPPPPPRPGGAPHHRLIVFTSGSSAEIALGPLGAHRGAAEPEREHDLLSGCARVGVQGVAEVEPRVEPANAACEGLALFSSVFLLCGSVGRPRPLVLASSSR